MFTFSLVNRSIEPQFISLIFHQIVVAFSIWFGVPFSTFLCVAFEEVTGFIVSVGHHSICGRILVSQPFRINRLIDFLFWVSTILAGVAGWELLASGRVPFGDVADTGHIFATASEDGKNVNLTVK